MSNIVLTRFNDETWTQNQRFRIRHNLGCVYGTPFTLSKFDPGEVLFVIEMNNQQNRVEGIGMVLNSVKTGPQYNIYSNENYNRFVYCGKYRLDRSDLESLTCKPLAEADPTAPEKTPVKVLEMLDHLLFKGRSHQKRGSYLSKLTETILYKGGTTCKKLQDAIVRCFVETYKISITLCDEFARRKKHQRMDFTYIEYRPLSSSPPSVSPPSISPPSVSPLPPTPSLDITSP